VEYGRGSIHKWRNAGDTQRIASPVKKEHSFGQDWADSAIFVAVNVLYPKPAPMYGHGREETTSRRGNDYTLFKLISRPRGDHDGPHRCYTADL
jgi:hypothetical protein